MTCSEKIRELIQGSPKKLKRIARDADVDYQTLRRWYVEVGAFNRLDTDCAERVYQSLTGKTFMPEEGE